MRLSTAAIHAEAAALMIRYGKSQRVGQAYFNALATARIYTAYDYHQKMSDLIVGTSFDPFDNDDNLERFLAYLRYQLGEFDDEIASVQP